MKFMLLLALLSAANCHHMYHGWNLYHDLNSDCSDGQESSEEMKEAPVVHYVTPVSGAAGPLIYHAPAAPYLQPQPSPAFWGTGSPFSFVSTTAQVLPPTFGNLDIQHSAFNMQGPNLRSFAGEKGSLVFPDAPTSQVLPTASDGVNKSKLRSAFHDKGSPLSPESTSTKVLPTAYKKVYLPRSSLPMGGLKLKSAFHEKGSPISEVSSTSRVLPSAVKNVNI